METSKEAPCKEKACGFCCNPVKVSLRRGIQIPKDAKGNDLWEQIEGIYASEEYIETERLLFYACKNFNHIMNHCDDYSNRPEICRLSSCIRNESKESQAEQHTKATSIKFIRIR